jgi:hypothetical protein
MTSRASSGAALRVLVHQAGEQRLVERAPVDADAHRLVVRIAISTMAANWRSFLSLKPTLPGLMRYLSSASAQAGMIGEQLVADVVEVADERHVDTPPARSRSRMMRGRRRRPRRGRR